MDIDIDFPSDFDPLDYFKDGIRASMVKDDNLIKHNAGVYFQTIPVDAVTNLAAIPFKEAEKLGYFKIDFLHINLLNDFKSKHEIRELLKIEPDWSLMESQEVVEKLFQIHKHFDVVQIIKPRSMEDICDCISVIRPGKKILLHMYTEDKARFREELYKTPDEPKAYYFKRSHALAYSANVILQLHLIKLGIL